MGLSFSASCYYVAIARGRYVEGVSNDPGALQDHLRDILGTARYEFPDRPVRLAIDNVGEYDFDAVLTESNGPLKVGQKVYVYITEDGRPEGICRMSCRPVSDKDYAGRVVEALVY
jgi:hypothetical protein